MRALLIALIISIVAHIGTGLAYLAQRDKMTEAKTSLKTAQDAAESCSRDVERLGKLADSRKVAAAKARAAAATAAKTRDQQADQILSTPASTPGNDCKSAQDRAGTWLAGRARP